MYTALYIYNVYIYIFIYLYRIMITHAFSLSKKSGFSLGVFAQGAFCFVDGGCWVKNVDLV